MAVAVGTASAGLSLDADGVAHSARFDDVYHSTDGAFAQARHVFLAGNRLPGRWQGHSTFAIIEAGFGLGVNFLETWHTARVDGKAPARLDYIAADLHPPQAAELERFHARNAVHPALARELIRRWPPLTRGFHRIELDGGRIALTLLIGDAAGMLAELEACVDAFYLDGFTPQKNPAMWSEALLREVARLSAAGATAATWTVAAVVRERLASHGFRVSKRKGFGRKREMLVAERTGGQSVRQQQRTKRAVVIGAGLAGVWCAHALARRGWDVELIERGPRPAEAASGMPVGAVRPALNVADNDNAQVARAALLLATRTLADCPSAAESWSQTGVLHLATDAADESRMTRIEATHSYPREYAALIDGEEASRRVGRRVPGPGWWIPLGGWARPARLCASLLQLHGSRIACRFHCEAMDIVQRDDDWHVLDRERGVIAAAPTLILAPGHETQRFAGLGMPAMVPVRGQVTCLPSDARRALDIVVCGDGYVAPLPGGGHCVGATFQPDDADATMRSADHAQNLERLERMLPGFGAGLSAGALDGRAGVRSATADRLPACGRLTVPDRFAAAQSLHVVTGLGARGLIFAPLCAEVIASRLEGEPNLLERRLLRALDPARLGERPMITLE